MPRFSKSFLFPDVNVWVALTYGGHVHHAAANLWFMSLETEERICFCRFTQLSLLRLLTTQAVMGDEVMTQLDAWKAYDRWWKDGRIVFAEEPPNLEEAFRALSSQHRPATKNWADAYLAAFASALAMRFVTFDGAFREKLDSVLILKP